METIKLVFMDLENLIFNKEIEKIPPGAFVSISCNEFCELKELRLHGIISATNLEHSAWLMFDVLPQSFIKDNIQNIKMTGYGQREFLNNENIHLLKACV